MLSSVHPTIGFMRHFIKSDRAPAGLSLTEQLREIGQTQKLPLGAPVDRSQLGTSQLFSTMPFSMQVSYWSLQLTST